MKKKVVFLGLAPLLPVLCFLSVRLEFPLTLNCTRVIDGDTIVVQGLWDEFKVRLLYIDAPEMGQKRSGDYAKKILKNLVEGKEVKLTKRAKDFYGRTLAQVHVDELDVNLEMIKRGGAFIYHYAKFLSTNHKIDYQIELNRAKIKGVGIYKNEDLQDPYWFRQHEKRKRAKL